MRKGMKIGLAASASLLMAQSPPPSPSDTIWYVIAAENGARLGYGSRQIVQTPQGREVIDLSQVRLREQENDPVWRIVERSVTRIDPAGRVVSISDASQMGLIRSS